MTNPIDLINATIFRQALSLMRDDNGKVTTGPKFKKGYDLIAKMRIRDLDAALKVLEEQNKTVERLQAIADRHKAKGTETFNRIVKRAAKAGDTEAIDVLASGVLDQVPV
jgi:hypothetical protein